jgi:hypothetical protein
MEAGILDFESHTASPSVESYSGFGPRTGKAFEDERTKEYREDFGQIRLKPSIGFMNRGNREFSNGRIRAIGSSISAFNTKRCAFKHMSVSSACFSTRQGDDWARLIVQSPEIRHKRGCFRFWRLTTRHNSAKFLIYGNMKHISVSWNFRSVIASKKTRPKAMERTLEDLTFW